MKIEIPRYGDVWGLPSSGKCFVFSNSERQTAACPKKWWYRYVEGLSTPESQAMRLGTAWHSISEDIDEWHKRTESDYETGNLYVCAFCVDSDDPSSCDRCEGTRLGPVNRTGRGWQSLVVEGVITPEELSAAVQKLEDMAIGYLNRYGRGPMRQNCVIATELGIAREVLKPDGKQFKPIMYIVEEIDGSSRIAGSGEVANPDSVTGTIKKVRWPWYQVGRLDGVIRNRFSGDYYIKEVKSSSAPASKIRNLHNDPQHVGYAWLLQAYIEGGQLEPGEVKGTLYDVASTATHSKPQLLKNGTLSKAKNKNFPSWAYREEVMRLGLPMEDYADYIQDLAARVDPKLYLRERPVFNAAEIRRYGNEVYSFVVETSARWRAAAKAESLDDIDVAFARVPLCRMPGGFCSYTEPCSQDGEDVRRNFKISDQIVWSKKC